MLDRPSIKLVQPSFKLVQPSPTLVHPLVRPSLTLVRAFTGLSYPSLARSVALHALQGSSVLRLTLVAGRHEPLHHRFKALETASRRTHGAKRLALAVEQLFGSRVVGRNGRVGLHGRLSARSRLGGSSAQPHEAIRRSRGHGRQWTSTVRGQLCRRAKNAVHLRIVATLGRARRDCFFAHSRGPRRRC